jgi:predicted DNA-binding transcriptional regulator AlpA
VQHKAILNTWKEIAQYVGRSVRTIQRWERELGFPIHRPRGKQRSAVIAMPPEIDEWARRTPSAGVPTHATNITVLDRTKWQQRQTDKQVSPTSDQNNGQKRAPRLRAGR